MVDKEFLIVANWKAYDKVARQEQTSAWLERFLVQFSQSPKVGVVICPPYHLLLFLRWLLEKNSASAISLGVQDLSQFSAGAHTGEVSAEMVQGLAEFAILGHSERRREAGETDERVTAKVKNALGAGIIPIVCLDEAYISSQIEDLKKAGLSLAEMVFAYEPVAAIGTGKPETVESAQKVAGEVKRQSGSRRILYGGSVAAQNAHHYLAQEAISGLLVGGASTDPAEFARIVASANL